MPNGILLKVINDLMAQKLLYIDTEILSSLWVSITIGLLKKKKKMKRETEIGEILKHLLLPTTQHVQEIPFFFFWILTAMYTFVFLIIEDWRSFLSSPVLSSRQGCHNKISQAG